MNYVLGTDGGDAGESIFCHDDDCTYAAKATTLRVYRSEYPGDTA